MSAPLCRHCWMVPPPTAAMLTEQIATLTAENARLTVALNFYADPANWEREHPGCSTEIEDDGGCVALVVITAGKVTT